MVKKNYETKVCSKRKEKKILKINYKNKSKKVNEKKTQNLK